jgi:GT2 family glycosyltransferase
MLDRLLDCVRNANVCQQIYLIDNSPHPTDIPAFHLPDVIYIRSDKNLGYGAGHNVALRKAIETSDFHFVLNPDVYFAPGELIKMLQRMAQDPRVGQLMPKVIYPDGSLQYLCKLIPTPFDLLFRRFLVGPFRPLARKKLQRFELRFTGYDREMDVPYLSGCFMLFRMSSLRDIGLFDERFFMYPEDIDITRRMHAVHRTLFFPDATIIHDHARASYSSGRMLRIHIVNLIRYFNKWGWFFDPGRKVANSKTLQRLTKSCGHP